MIAMHMPTMPTFHPASVLPVCLTSGKGPRRALWRMRIKRTSCRRPICWRRGGSCGSMVTIGSARLRRSPRHTAKTRECRPPQYPYIPFRCKESMARTENDEVPLKVPKEAIWPEDDAELCAPIPVLAVPTPIPITSPEPTALPNEPITPSLSLPRIVHPVHPRDRPQLRQGVLIREALRAHGSAVPDMAPEDLATFLPRPLSLTPPTAVTPAPRRERRRVGTRGRASRRRSTIPAPKQDGELVWLQRGIFLPSPRLEEGPSRIPRPIWQSFVDLLDYF
ncbi:hypothetical protein OF83DRAFT_799242 [Amylostereum chailletii]|nr:hypothetical protein OF83DRAFT_799242 [Amylostereum chailletii]